MGKTIDFRNYLFGKMGEMQTLKAVYEYETDESKEYPYGTLHFLGWAEGEMVSTAQNIRIWKFLARVQQERAGHSFSPKKAERIVLEVADEFQEAFDMDTTLSGLAVKVTPIIGDAGYLEDKGPTRTMDITIEVQALTNAK